eukprot:m.5821 g.5821  ORF g.5821 m.5821 type:complete len:813 (+) comp4633_c0_seq1:165-2603(+)
MKVAWQFVLPALLGLAAGALAAADPAELQRLYMEGVHAVNGNDLKKAEKCFKKIVAEAPMVVEGFLNLAVVYERGLQWGKAMDVYRKARTQHPTSPRIPVNMCVTLLRLIQEGNTFGLEGEGNRVREICGEARRLNKDDPTVHSSLGDMHTLLVDWDDAAAAYKEALNLYETAVRTKTLDSKPWKDGFAPQRTWSNLANSYSRAGHVASAVEAAARALAIEPHDPHNLALVGTIRTTGRKFDFQTRVFKRRSALILASRMAVRDGSCPSGKWSLEFAWPLDGSTVGGQEKKSKKSKNTASILNVLVTNPNTRSTWYGLFDPPAAPRAVLRWTIPSPLTPYPTRYHERTIVFVELSDAFIGGPSGVIHRDCVIYAGGHGEDARLHETNQFGSPVETITELPGPAVSLMSQNMRNYYHFVCEGMVRLVLTLQYLKTRPDIPLSSLTWILPSGLSYTKPFLTLLGLEDLKVYEYSGGPNRLLVSQLYLLDWQADEIQPALEERGIPVTSDADPYDDSLWDVTSWPDFASLPTIETGRELAHDPWSQFYPPRAGLVLLRDHIRSALGPVPAGAWHLVYLSRHDSMTGDFGIRVVRNEEILVDALRAMVGPSRFTLFRGKDLSIANQFSSFARAAVVVAPHGAGLANLVACSPNTTLVLFPMRPHVDNTFGHMAAALELDLWIAPDITSYYYGAYSLLTSSSANHVLDAVSVALTEKGLAHTPQQLTDEPFDAWLEEHPRHAESSIEADLESPSSTATTPAPSPTTKATKATKATTNSKNVEPTDKKIKQETGVGDTVVRGKKSTKKKAKKVASDEL